MPRRADQHRDQQHAVVQRLSPLEPPGPLDKAHADDLLSAAGHGDVSALGAFYDHTAPAVFGLLQCALGEPARAAQATERVYRQLWRAAPHFDPATGDAYALLLRTARRELIGPLRELVTDGRAQHHAVPVDRNDISPEPSSNSDTGPAGPGRP